jgi:hypothetical protein
MNSLLGAEVNKSSTSTTRTRARKGIASQADCNSLKLIFPLRRVVFNDSMSGSPSFSSKAASVSRWE